MYEYMSLTTIPMSHLSVGLVITTFNNSDTILRALNSALTQDCPFEQIVITDDGSQDDTINKIEFFLNELGSEFARKVTILTHKNIGTFENFKLGMNKLKTDFALGLAGDDALLSDCCGSIKKYIYVLKKKEILVGKLKPLRELNDGVLVKKKNTYKSGFSSKSMVDLIFLKSSNISPGGGVVYPRESVVQILNSYNLGKIHWEDWLTFFILSFHDFRFRSITDEFYMYIVKEYHTGTSSNKQLIDINKKKLIDFFNSLNYDEKSWLTRILIKNHLFWAIIFMKKVIILLARLNIFMILNKIIFFKRKLFWSGINND